MYLYYAFTAVTIASQLVVAGALVWIAISLRNKDKKKDK